MLNTVFFQLEKLFSKLQGKGWGTGTVARELACAAELLAGKTPELCIDIGGNKGLYTAEILKAFPKCDVVVFEPAQSNLDILRKQFNGQSNVTIVPSAVSDADGEAVLFSNEAGSGLASLTKRRLDHFDIDLHIQEPVKTIRFETFWQETLGGKNIGICKLDIEGHELSALSGFGEALGSIDVIQFEFGGCNIDTRTFFQDFWYFFTENGFDVYRISPIGLAPITKYNEAEENFRTTNYLAKRRH